MTTGTDRRAGTLLALATALAATDSVEDVALAVRDVARADLDACYAAVSMIEGPWLTTPALGQLDDDTEQRWLRLPLDLDSPAHRVARSGRPLVFATRDELLGAFPGIADPLRRTGLRAGYVLPLLISGGFRIGALSIAWDEDRPLVEEDRQLVTAFAGATAQAARRAQLYRERRDVAHTLQAAMLPELPTLPGLELASRYLPWSPTDEQVGGDWYDVIPVPDGGVLLLIGDVAGHDIEAAARMGRVRSMFRALAVDHPEEDPAALVSRLDHVLDVLHDQTLATMAVVRLDPPGTPRTVRWTTAGHPPPLLVDPRGRSSALLREPDLPLGVAPDRPRHDHELPWPAGGSLVLYTDGLVERRGRDVGEGIRDLRSRLERTHTEPLEALLTELVAEHAATSEDDCAVLAVRDLP
ncbi:PP2C family protein-serine/threonine phosphatase [Kineococcus rhizosphaerae]|uniref:Serine phosphatase RsbU (Regulator of sigma subunit) n=1 Tax=Kineococcus rhizosphaerae TaxID=559628 RepID=A0A2T0R597_9ACTN|nr:PP2C family protein-serine/threonine phosphatase [Kineococcus rhizosphaerae]PRY15914.1 serine phosphatase RsbU (regulator of sigma subunit) [Kineococcus rhizosphaerae]